MENKVVVVTSSFRGIRKAIVTDFALNVYDVVINYKKEENQAKELK